MLDELIRPLVILGMTLFGGFVLLAVIRIGLYLAAANENLWDYSDEELNRYAEDDSELIDADSG